MSKSPPTTLFRTDVLLLPLMYRLDMYRQPPPPGESLAIALFIRTGIFFGAFRERDSVVLVNMDTEVSVGEADFPAGEADGGVVNAEVVLVGRPSFEAEGLGHDCRCSGCGGEGGGGSGEGRGFVGSGCWVWGLVL